MLSVSSTKIAVTTNVLKKNSTKPLQNRIQRMLKQQPKRQSIEGTKDIRIPKTNQQRTASTIQMLSATNTEVTT